MVAGTLAALATADADRLIEAIQELSHLRDLDGVMAVVRRVARELVESDGVTFVLREGDRVYYAEENAIGPLWKGCRFPANACISGWAMIHRETVAIEDIYADPRVPVDAYRPTFVKSLAMVPIRREDPLGAIGAYWAARHAPTPRELALLESLAAATATAVRNAELLAELERAVEVREEFMAIASHEFRTPITPMKLQLQALARRLDALDGEAIRGALAKIEGYVDLARRQAAGRPARRMPLAALAPRREEVTTLARPPFVPIAGAGRTSNRPLAELLVQRPLSAIEWPLDGTPGSSSACSSSTPRRDRTEGVSLGAAGIASALPAA